MSDRPEPSPRSAFHWFCPVTTRWNDNDVYGHVNNVIYYLWFDTAVNRFLGENGLFEMGGSEPIGIVAETGCRYFESVSFPENIEVGLALARLGRSSVEYRIGIFREGGKRVVAEGRFVHVYVDRESRRPVAIPHRFRQVFEQELAER